MPKIGDQVWFYFLHAFTDVKLQDDLWRATGKFEMRCRPALVSSVSKNPELRMHPDLRVEFACDDMTPAWMFWNVAIMDTGVAIRLEPKRLSVNPHIDRVVRDGDFGRIIDGRWPNRNTWAWDPMPGFEGGRR